MNAALAIALLLAAPSAHKARPMPALMPLDLYASDGTMLVSCRVDEIGNVTDCALIGDKQKALDAVVTRMVEQMKAGKPAQFRRVREQ